MEKSNEHRDRQHSAKLSAATEEATWGYEQKETKQTNSEFETTRK
jgi:hypothetical protein